LTGGRRQLCNLPYRCVIWLIDYAESSMNQAP
jgi:hypothetical protein